jgi:hypothetical protein
MHELLERLEAILRAEGFTHATTWVSAHTWTLSADRGEMRALVHFTDRDEVPDQSAAIATVPEAASMRMKAGFAFPGMPTPNQASGPAGQGSSPPAEG